VIVVACITARAQVQSSPAKSSEETGTISGRVVSDSGQPVAGASLFVRSTNSITSFRSTTTDAEGNFRVSNLETGLYSVSALAPTYAFDQGLGTRYYRIGDSVNLELLRGGVITGTAILRLTGAVHRRSWRLSNLRIAAGHLPRQRWGWQQLPEHV